MDERTRLKLKLAKLNHAALLSGSGQHEQKAASGYASLSWNHAEALLKLAESKSDSSRSADTKDTGDLIVARRASERLGRLLRESEEARDSIQRQRDEYHKQRDEALAELQVQRSKAYNLESDIRALRAAAHEMRELLGLGDVSPHEIVECVKRLCDENESIVAKSSIQPNMHPRESHGALYAIRSSNAKSAERPVLTSNRLVAQEMAEALKVPVYRVRLEEILMEVDDDI